MNAIATIGNLIEVAPLDSVQYWANAHDEFVFVDDRTPFRFVVEGELVSEGLFFGLHGPIQSGPDRYQGQVCSIMLRNYDSDWNMDRESHANFKVGPTVVKRVTDFEWSEETDWPWYLHPEATTVDGFPRSSRFASVTSMGTAGENEKG